MAAEQFTKTLTLAPDLPTRPICAYYLEKLGRAVPPTKKELEKLLDDEAFAMAKKVQLVEVVMDMVDAPRALRVQAQLSVKANKYVM